MNNLRGASKRSTNKACPVVPCEPMKSTTYVRACVYECVERDLGTKAVRCAVMRCYAMLCDAIVDSTNDERRTIP